MTGFGGRRLRLSVLALAAVYLAALGAGFLAPYGYARQHRQYPLAAPTRIHFVDDEGRLHPRPFVYSPGAEGEPRQRRPLKLFVRGPVGLHLFGVEEPGVIFLLGTDELGRDQFSRLLHGARVSLFAGALAGLLAVALGTVLGAAAGFFGGWVDDLLMRLVELALALPWLYLLLAVRAFLPLHLAPGWSFVLVIGVIALLGWAAPARLARGVALAVRRQDLVEAARSTGLGSGRILLRHVLPQTANPAITQLALLIPQFILAEVTLSFLGLGVSEPMPSWGGMLSALRSYAVLTTGWWMLAPAFALAVVVLSYHQLATALQEHLNPLTT